MPALWERMEPFDAGLGDMSALQRGSVHHSITKRQAAKGQSEMTKYQLSKIKAHTILVGRVACALDRTSCFTDADRRPRTMRIREELATWLDKAIATSEPIQPCRILDLKHLESIQLSTLIAVRDEDGIWYQNTANGQIISSVF